MNDRERYYYVYIMASLSGTLYVGVTNSIGRRVQQHKRGEGSAFTSRYRVNRLVYYESFRYIINAISREKEIKGWKRSKKVELIESLNPGWRDLGRDLGRQYQRILFFAIGIPRSARNDNLRCGSTV
ncbi:MAG TPA: GIY-YIG nuclease family protein [Terriglobales bacterium]|nr:GIY-YIG nuclease family protein [Terriglobales bacterium]